LYNFLSLQGGPDGLIQKSERVFPVGGQKLEGDYHDNIDSKYYFDWFRQLCVNINEEYNNKNAIIVIDNAPYHTTSDAPKSNAKKQELLNYLVKIDNDGKLTGFDKTQKYLRPQLWEMVLKYKKENPDHYLIDKLAKEYGHTVVR